MQMWLLDHCDHDDDDDRDGGMKDFCAARCRFFFLFSGELTDEGQRSSKPDIHKTYKHTKEHTTVIERNTDAYWMMHIIKLSPSNIQIQNKSPIRMELVFNYFHTEMKACQRLVAQVGQNDEKR